MKTANQLTFTTYEAFLTILGLSLIAVHFLTSSFIYNLTDIGGGMPLALLKPLLQGGWRLLTTMRSPEWHTLAEPACHRNPLNNGHWFKVLALAPL